MVSRVERLFGGKLLIGIPYGVVDEDSLGKGNVSGVAGTLG